MKRAARSFFLVAALMLVVPSSALAHGELVTTKPADGSTNKKAPDHVRINLTETPSDKASVKVTDGCNTDVVDEVYTTGKTLHVLLDKGRPGNWVVDYKVISKEDGHKTASAFTFAVKGKVDCSAPAEPDPDEKNPSDPDDTVAEDIGPDASAPSADETSLPIIPIAIGFAVLLGLAFVVRTVSSKR